MIRRSIMMLCQRIYRWIWCNRDSGLKGSTLQLMQTGGVDFGITISTQGVPPYSLFNMERIRGIAWTHSHDSHVTCDPQACRIRSPRAPVNRGVSNFNLFLKTHFFYRQPLIILLRRDTSFNSAGWNYAWTKVGSEHTKLNMKWNEVWPLFEDFKTFWLPLLFASANFFK